jgi:hypothetical protein
MYLLYESLYGELLYDCESTLIVGLYKTEQQAINKANELMSADIQEYGYVLDNERDNLKRDKFVRLFRDTQENWSCYYEIIIEKIELEKESD